MLTIIEHEDYYKHKMPQILESPRRLKVIMKALEESNLLDKPYVKKISPELVNEDIIKTLHKEELLEQVKHASLMGQTAITGDTLTNEHTFTAAKRAIGGAILASEIAISGNNSAAFALIRPPGHHATSTNAMGFCFFNNIALAANNLLEKKKAKKIAIIDFDNHYGNGTADLFYDRSDVLTISLHADPRISFPFQGRVIETGEQEGIGYNICIPLPPGTGDKEYLNAFDKFVPSIIREYKPDIIFVAAGYDGLHGDPYGYLGLTVTGIQCIMERITQLSKEVCNGKIMITLEGGYKFTDLGQAFLANIQPLLPDYSFNDKKLYSKLSSGGNKGAIKNTIMNLKKVLKPHWRLD